MQSSGTLHVYLGWYELTSGWQLEGDDEKMTALTKITKGKGGRVKMKSTITKIAALCLSTILFTGCAGTSGTNFTQVAGENNLVLGRSTPEQVTANLGKPMREAR